MAVDQAPSKASHLSKRINEEIKRVAAMMGSVCFAGAVASTVWSAEVCQKQTCFTNFILIFLPLIAAHLLDPSRVQDRRYPIKRETETLW